MTDEMKAKIKNAIAWAVKAAMVIGLIAGMVWLACVFVGWTKKKFFSPAPTQATLVVTNSVSTMLAPAEVAKHAAKVSSSASAEEDDEDSADPEQAVFSSTQFALEENHRICIQPGDRLEIQNERGTSIKWGFPKGYPESKKATVQFRPDGKPVDPDFVPDGSAAPLKFLVVRNRGETPATIFLRFSEWKSRQGWTPVKSGPVTTESIKSGFNRQKNVGSGNISTGSVQETEHQIRVEVKMPTTPTPSTTSAPTNTVSSSVMPTVASPAPQQVAANNTTVVLVPAQVQAIASSTMTNVVGTTVTSTNVTPATNNVLVVIPPQAPAEKAGGSN